MSKLKLVELFTGTGAFSLAFENTKKVETIFANDFCKNSEKIFNENFLLKLSCSNINDIKITDIPKMDILTGGFPCQPFSIAGEQKGFDDERSNVFWKILKIIKAHKPRIVILENVKNLQSHDNGETFKVITNELDKLKYYYKHTILNTSEYSSIPQNRERIYIVCFKNKEDYNKFNFPDKIDVKKKKLLSSMMETTVDSKYYYTADSAIWDKLTDIKEPISKNVIYQYRRYYVRENKNNVCPTLTANMGTGGHNVPLIKDKNGIRKLTPRECFNLQGFPQTYKLPTNLSNAALYKLAGNAVSYPIVEKLANIIINILFDNTNLINEECIDEVVEMPIKKSKKKVTKIAETPIEEVKDNVPKITEIPIKKSKKKTTKIIDI